MFSFLFYFWYLTPEFFLNNNEYGEASMRASWLAFYSKLTCSAGGIDTTFKHK